MRAALLSFLLGLSALLPDAAAQGCPYSVSFARYATACGTSGFPAPSLNGSFSSNPQGCTLGLVVTAVPGCCNTYTVGSLAIIGLQPARIPIYRHCDLLVAPLSTLPLASLPATPGSFAAEFALPPDPALRGADIYAQAVVVRFTTIGLNHDFDFTQGLQLMFR